MKIIPVMDILNGKVVHAVKGKRSEYQPLKSALCDSDNPLAVASVFSICGFCELYVADLDVILGKGTNITVLEQITEKTGLGLMVDAGISNLKLAQDLFNSKVAKVIVGTETSPSLSFIEEAIERFGSGKIVVSLDLKHGKVLGKSEELTSMDAMDLAFRLQSLGVSELIVLDLARVGSGEGIDVSLLKEMLHSLKVKVLVGGGIRDMADLKQLNRMGVYGALLATALHSERISIEQLRNIMPV